MTVRRQKQAALVGYGLAGRAFHAPLIGATQGLLLSMIVSSNPARVHADLPDVAVVAGLGAVLGDDAIDLVVLATPDHLHAEQALAALEAGKHVVIDKPFAPTLDEAERVAAFAQARGLTLSVFHNRRWDADFLTLAPLVRSGQLGEIVQFESHFDRFRPEPTDRWKDRRGGGVWQDLGPHLIDQALCLFGMPLAVQADLAVLKEGGHAPDYAHVTLRYARLRVILHMTQIAAANGLRFVVHGTQGSYTKHGLDAQEAQSIAGLTPGHTDWGLDPRSGILTTLNPTGMLEESAIPNTRGDYTTYYRALHAALYGLGPNPVPPAQALDVMRVFEAGLQSSAEAREIGMA